MPWSLDSTFGRRLRESDAIRRSVRESLSRPELRRNGRDSRALRQIQISGAGGGAPCVPTRSIAARRGAVRAIHDNLARRCSRTGVGAMLPSLLANASRSNDATLVANCSLAQPSPDHELLLGRVLVSLVEAFDPLPVQSYVPGLCLSYVVGTQEMAQLHFTGLVSAPWIRSGFGPFGIQSRDEHPAPGSGGDVLGQDEAAIDESIEVEQWRQLD